MLYLCETYTVYRLHTQTFFAKCLKPDCSWQPRVILLLNNVKYVNLYKTTRASWNKQQSPLEIGLIKVKHQSENVHIKHISFCLLPAFKPEHKLNTEVTRYEHIFTFKSVTDNVPVSPAAIEGANQLQCGVTVWHCQVSLLHQTQKPENTVISNWLTQVKVNRCGPNYNKSTLALQSD